MADMSILEEILDNSLSVEFVTNFDYQFKYANHAFFTKFGYDDINIESFTFLDLMLHESEHSLVSSMRDAALSGDTSHNEILHMYSNNLVSSDIYIRCTYNHEDNCFIWSGIDINMFTDKLNEVSSSLNQLKLQEFKMNFALEYAKSLYWEITSDFKKIVFSNTFEKLMGFKQSDYDYNFMRFIDTHLKSYKEEVVKQVNDCINEQVDMLSVEISMQDTNGNIHWLLVRGALNKEMNLLYGVSVDITEQKSYQKRLSEMAYIDTLTGLYKTEYIKDAMKGLIETVELTNVGLMILDIYKFGSLNSMFGHERANAVLIYIASRLKKLAKDGIVVRAGGDEFMIVFNNISDTSEIEKLAGIITNEFTKPLELDGHTYYIKLKIGIAASHNETQDFEIIFKDAHMALQHTKNYGTQDICVINSDIWKSTDDDINMRFELSRAIERKEFFLHYQPIISTKTKKMIGTEALIRWNNPDRGLINPLKFIPIAEETGLINQIGDFVLIESLKNLNKWIKKDKDFFTSINISVIQFMLPNLSKRILDLIKDYSIPPTGIITEITESIFITDMGRVTDILNELRDSGIRVSLDDFGTGYSSLSYLKKIPLDSLKIDRSFIMDVINDPASDAILKSIITMAQNLNLSVTAEGVETEEQFSLLEKYGCDRIQGYLFSKPVLPETIDEYLLYNQMRV